MKNNIEILAPVGSGEMLRAAVLCGADAVYMGGRGFNARRNAENFSENELKKAIKYCHDRGVKVHITLNTLIKEAELSPALDTVYEIYRYGADAVIVQDLGLAAAVSHACPEIEMHASTQLSTGSLEGLRLLHKLGFSRGVLPRELSFKEIADICRSSPVDIEVFVHGAQCMCVSGQCLMSAVLGSRSGNRGLCAQPCRLPFSVKGGTNHDLSLKDLSIISDIPRLADLGVRSFKIEGRMKRPEYVAAAVTACKAAAEGKSTEEITEDLEALFSRSGFTDGYLKNQLGRQMFGFRQKENVESATPELLSKYASLYEKEAPRYPVDFEFTARCGEKARLKAVAKGNSAEVLSESTVEPATGAPLTEEKIRSALSKCGGTPFYLNGFTADIADGLFLPVSALNLMRRQAFEQLYGEEQSREILKILPVSANPSENKRKFICRFDSASQMPDGLENSVCFIPLEEYGKSVYGENVGVELPRGMFGNSERVDALLKNCKAKTALCHTVDGLALALKHGIEPIASPFFNIMNTRSANTAKSLGVKGIIYSFEASLKELSGITEPASGVAVYGRIPLMLTRNCPVKNGMDCKECKRSQSITDRMGVEFPVRCRMGFSEILNSRPLYMADRLSEVPDCDMLYFHFTVETAEEANGVLNAYKLKLKPQGEFTRGLLYRGVE